MTEDWNDLVSKLIKLELSMQGVSYMQLVDKLAAIGVEETESSIKSKLKRGTFSHAFAVQCGRALGLRSLRIEMPPPLE